MYYDNYLAHHGIKGQKWGVRRFQNYDGTLIRSGRGETIIKKNKDGTVTQTDTGRGISAKRNKDGSITTVNTKDYVYKAHDSTTKSNHKNLNRTLAAAVYSWGGVSANAALAATTGYINPLSLLITSAAAVGSTAYLAIGGVSASKANSKEKKFEKEKEGEPIDKKTGFHKKTQKLSLEEDVERINPSYKNWSSNNKNNCALCTVTAELRLRGYDVTAKKVEVGYSSAQQRNFWKNAKSVMTASSLSNSEVMTNAIMGTKMDKKRQAKMIDETISQISSVKNQRGDLSVMWDGTTAGHSMMYMNDNGTIKIIDGQANKIYSGEKEVRELLKKTCQVETMRLDNLQINTDVIKEAAA